MSPLNVPAPESQADSTASAQLGRRSSTISPPADHRPERPRGSRGGRGPKGVRRAPPGAGPPRGSLAGGGVSYRGPTPEKPPNPVPSSRPPPSEPRDRQS